MSRIAIVGEAPGKDDVLLGKPFVGTSGQELRTMLAQGGIEIDSCSLLNVFSLRPPENKIEAFCGKRADVGKSYSLPPLRMGCYFRPELVLPELARLRGELIALRPNLIIALGNTACWALLGSTGISKIRGSIAESTLCPGLKVLPTYHPSAVLRNWSLRSTTILDFTKAQRESLYPSINLPQREIWIDPDLYDLWDFYHTELTHASSIAYDIETAHGQITCIGFAPSKAKAIVVPLVDRRKTNYSYWPTVQLELQAWNFIRSVLQLPCQKITQNGSYDIQWLWQKLGLCHAGGWFDTMIAHHALYPELEKSLGFLGSIYTNEASWKLMRKRQKDEGEKSDE